MTIFKQLQYDYEKTLADPSEITTEVSLYSLSIIKFPIAMLQFTFVFQTDIIKAQDIDKDSADTIIHYAVLQSELTGELSKELEDSEKQKYFEDVDRLTKTIESIELGVEERKKSHESRMESAKTQYRHDTETLKKITYKLIANHEYRYKK